MALFVSIPVIAHEALLIDSVVKIYVTKSVYDYDNPWRLNGAYRASGTGFVIPGNRIMTNAHVVSDYRNIQVRKNGEAMRWFANLVAISHDVDLALLQLIDKESESFFQDVNPMIFGRDPELQEEVLVLGFPW